MIQWKNVENFRMMILHYILITIYYKLKNLELFKSKNFVLG